MPLLGRTVRFITRAGIGTGIVYYSYTLGVWSDDVDQTIANYEKLKKELNGAIQSLPPSLLTFAEEQKNAVKAKTVDPVKQSVTGFRDKWVPASLTSSPATQDGLIKPTWNAGIATTCDFLAHAPQIVTGWTVAGYRYASGYLNNSGGSENVATAQANSGKPSSYT